MGDFSNPDDHRIVTDNAVQNQVYARAKLLQNADNSYAAGKEYDSVLNQVEALCIGFRKEFKACPEKINLKDAINQMIEDIGSSMRTPSTPCKPKVPDYVIPDFSKYVSDYKPTDRPKPILPKHSSSEELLAKCSKLPKEWTVVQLTKQFDPFACSKMANELLTSSRGIYISLLKYPRMELHDNKPITVRVPAPKENLFEENFRIYELIKSTMKMKDVPQYVKSLQEIDKRIAEVIDKMYTWLGPYICLLLGEFNDPVAVVNESLVFNKIDDFLLKERITDTRITVLLSLICRGLDLLDDEDVESFVNDLTKGSHLSEKILNFIRKLTETSKLSYKANSFPCILIVEELLDKFFWEMLLPGKEMCRCSALYILVDIFEKYEHQIKDGYLRLHIDQGTALINLGDDLLNMQKRMSAFFDYWKPKWKQFVKISPTEAEILDVFKSSDVIVYSGHGSGQQFLNPENLRELNANCVVFLFGCESVNLVSYGTSSERIGIHLYYHSILCPLIVGALTIVADFPTDLISLLILSSWLVADKKREKHPQYIDRKKFKEGKFEFAAAKLFKECPDENDPNLLRIFTRVRQLQTLPLWMRSTFVLRGLPVYNTNKK